MKPRTDPRTHRHRSFIDDSDARTMTATYFEDDDNGTDDDKPPPSDESSIEENQYSNEEAVVAVAAEVVSVIETPDHEHAVVTPGDAGFNKRSDVSDEIDTPVSGGQVTDGDWESSDDESVDSDYDRRHAVVVCQSLERWSNTRR